MNKPIKAKNLPLFSIIDLDQLRREKHLEGTEVTDFFTARDGKVYLLMEQPSETQGNRTDYDELLAMLENRGFSLPTADEWAYLCGGCLLYTSKVITLIHPDTMEITAPAP